MKKGAISYILPYYLVEDLGVLYVITRDKSITKWGIHTLYTFTSNQGTDCQSSWCTGAKIRVWINIKYEIILTYIPSIAVVHEAFSRKILIIANFK